MTDGPVRTRVALPERAQVVIVGGGILGCAVAYQLTRRGWTDVVLLEQNSLTSGTTWHAAGLVTAGASDRGTGPGRPAKSRALRRARG